MNTQIMKPASLLDPIKKSLHFPPREKQSRILKRSCGAEASYTLEFKTVRQYTSQFHTAVQQNAVQYSEKFFFFLQKKATGHRFSDSVKCILVCVRLLQYGTHQS